MNVRQEIEAAWDHIWLEPLSGDVNVNDVKISGKEEFITQLEKFLTIKEMKMPESKYIVINENILAYKVEGSLFVGVLAGSVVRGGHDPKNGTIALSPLDNIRDATKEDFESYNVSPDGHLK